MPYLATKTPGRLFPRFESPPGIALNPLQPGAEHIRAKFTLPNCAELKLVVGCGCWLRRTSPDMPDELLDYPVPQSTSEASHEQRNHDALVDYLTAHFRQDGFVEFYGYFCGIETELPRAHRELPVEAIRHPHYHFHDGTHYRFYFERSP